MITFIQQVTDDVPAQHVVALTYHQRVKGRLRITTEQGLVAGIVTVRGVELLHGQKFSDGNGCVLEICAHAEPVSVAETESPLLFARSCYHVGNRHTEVQIEEGRLVYLRDHVLDEMLTLLGLKVTEQMLPFSPENGAYSVAHSHDHNHDAHDHDHEHEHEHE